MDACNFLIIESLYRFHDYYGDDFKVEYPTNSGQYLSLNEIADELSKRLTKLFLRDNKEAGGIWEQRQITIRSKL